MSAKELAIDATTRMPEGISWEELMEELEILTDLRRADAEIDAGDFVTHEEVKREIATWFPK
jgi:predicted transcriptional regulator